MLEVESNSVLIATVALIGVIGIAHPDFLAWGQLKEVVQNAAYIGIIAAGMAFLISMVVLHQGRVSAVLAGGALRTHAVLEAMNQGSNVSS